MTPTDVHPPAQEIRPRSLVFQLLGTAHSVTDRLTEALAELGLSPAGLDLLTRLAEAHDEPVPLDGDLRDLMVLLERDGLVRKATGVRGHVTVALTPLGAARQRAGTERLDATRRQVARALSDVESAALERALSALR
jgi:hypothetical protein